MSEVIKGERKKTVGENSLFNVYLSSLYVSVSLMFCHMNRVNVDFTQYLKPIKMFSKDASIRPLSGSYEPASTENWTP